MEEKGSCSSSCFPCVGVRLVYWSLARKIKRNVYRQLENYWSSGSIIKTKTFLRLTSARTAWHIMTVKAWKIHDIRRKICRPKSHRLLARSYNLRRAYSAQFGRSSLYQCSTVKRLNNAKFISLWFCRFASRCKSSTFC